MFDKGSGNRRFTLIAKEYGCFAFEFVREKRQLKSTSRLGDQEWTSGYFGGG